MKISRLITVSVVALLPVAGFAASFDCEKAKSKSEIAICMTPDLSKLDSDLANVYDAALKSEAATQSALRAAQREWLRVRDRCNDVTCISAAYKRRIGELEQVPRAVIPTNAATVDVARNPPAPALTIPSKVSESKAAIAPPVKSPSNTNPAVQATVTTAQKGGFWSGVTDFFKAAPEGAAERACESAFHQKFLKPGYVDTKIDVDFYRYADNTRRKMHFDESGASGFIYLKAGKFLEHASTPIGEQEAKWHRSLNWAYEAKGGGWNYWKCSLTRQTDGGFTVDNIRTASVDEIDAYDSARTKK